MPRAASSTGLIAATTRPVRRPKPKRVELSGPAIPAPFILRPFAGLYNPYPYGCSVLCNHPADNEAKDVVRRAKDTWASEGKALLLPPLQPGEASGQDQGLSEHQKQHRQQDDVGPLPEELFRRYTETDSRQPSPELGQGPSIMDTSGDGFLFPGGLEPSPRQRTTLVLDLRASAHDQQFQDSNTLSWRSLTLEPPPSSRRSELAADFSSARRKAPISARNRSAMIKSISPGRPVPVVEVSDTASSRSAPTKLIRENRENDFDDEDEDEDDDSSRGETLPPIKRRGKLRRKKRKCRRCSIYGQQTEVREPPEPSETQVSQIDDASSKGPTYPKLEETKQPSVDKTTTSVIRRDMPSSFLPPDVIKELSRELDIEVVEHEFNARRRYALEEVLRVTGGARSASRSSRQGSAQSTSQDIPRLFYRQSARFELLDSLSLVGLKPLDYLSRHVHVSDARKALFGRVFNKYREDESEQQQQQQQQQDVLKPRYMFRRHLPDALREVMGRILEARELDFLERSLGEPGRERLDFRMWCGICAFAERSLPELPRREEDPPPWLERADFERLERRLNSLASRVDDRLVAMLRLIRDR